MRICLIGDTHGYVPGLEAALEASRRHAPDFIVHCGDFLTSPFSPDPPGETIDLLRSENVQVIYGNNEVYFRDWGTPRWESTVAARRRRPDSPDYFLQHIAHGQAELAPADLAWLRALPGELSLDGARQGDVYVCHGMPGNPFAAIWDTNPAFTPDFTAEEIDSALSRDGVALGRPDPVRPHPRHHLAPHHVAQRPSGPRRPKLRPPARRRTRPVAPGNLRAHGPWRPALRLRPLGHRVRMGALRAA